MTFAKITGTGSYLPKKIMTNADWEQRVETNDAWIVERTGIHSRHIADETETASFMATQAAKLALERAQCSAEQIQLIIVATGTPDKIFPSTACLVQHQLAIQNCIAFDIQAACTGFIYALSIAEQYIKSGAIRHALVIGSELMSRLMDWQDRSTCVLFGDGAGAVVLQAKDTPGILSTNLYAEGKYHDLLYVDNAQLNCYEKKSVHPYIQMQGQKVFKIAVTQLGEMVKDIALKHNLDFAEIDWLIPHQANIRIIKAMADKLGMPMSKVICTVATHSNTSSASIPLALDVAVQDGRVQANQLLLFEAFGGGLTWGSALVRF